MEEAHGPMIRWGSSRKSSYSNGTGGACVSVKAGCDLPGSAPVIGIQDTKLPDGPTLVADRPTWTAFLASL